MEGCIEKVGVDVVVEDIADDSGQLDEVIVVGVVQEVCSAECARQGRGPVAKDFENGVPAVRRRAFEVDVAANADAVAGGAEDFLTAQMTFVDGGGGAACVQKAYDRRVVDGMKPGHKNRGISNLERRRDGKRLFIGRRKRGAIRNGTGGGRRA